MFAFFGRFMRRYFRMVFYMNLGFALSRWAKLELCLDMCIDEAFQHRDDSKISSEIPRSFKRKIQFLRRVIKNSQIRATPADHPLASVDLKSDSLLFLDKLADLGMRRHNIVHSASHFVYDKREILNLSSVYERQSIKFEKQPMIWSEFDKFLDDTINATDNIGIILLALENIESVAFFE